jgi:two-component system NtrC family response regulator
MNKPKLLIVEDEETIRQQMKWALNDDYEVILAEDRQSALERMRVQRPSLIALDLGLPPVPRGAAEGLKALGELLAMDRQAKVIVITGNHDKANALKAIEQGAFDFFAKPADLQELKVVLKRAVLLSNLERENTALREQVIRQGFEEIMGESPAMQQVFSVIRKVATTDASVLIMGESGTGKELVAKAIHRASNRSQGPFITINCGAIPETLLESELFGHEKGSFTGADVRRKGKIEYADGGTLFLDEIGELSAALQVKLLRFLQEHQIERVGGRETIQVNVRVIAATNRDLKQDIAERRFREDLYYRLGVVTVVVPPLRERKGDLALLAKTFLQKFSLQYQKELKGFSGEALEAIHSYIWPGNVRELENRVRRAVIMSEGKILTANDLELRPAVDAAPSISLREVREQVEQEQIKKVLLKCNWNISKAALELGVTRPTLHDLIKKYRISKNTHH